MSCPALDSPTVSGGGHADSIGTLGGPWHFLRKEIPSATHRVLPQGTPETVRDEVRRRIGDLGPAGGYGVCPVHNIQPEVPPENVVAMYAAAYELGRYPLKV